ncbi:PepSY domain-containing protein [Desulfosarcina sp. OttesenSCG-928-A07]|nr:PepSY domain-containing protein [Desulfosarcina sp. OttesenSCG-928-G17]MDL2328812.1 PepSY domain-containing protein [Desulfosarcina sp. OttesenSCG-928-A07]
MTETTQSKTLRQSMMQLHTWAGLPLGWMFFFIFVMGAISFYHTEITFWMQPETHRARPSDQGVDKAMAVLQREALPAGPWMIGLSNERTPYLSAMWQDSSAAPPGGGHRGGMKRVIIDPSTGDTIDTRQTAGGGFLYRLHVNLFGLDRMTGMTLIAIITLVMFLVLISGLFIHPKIFKDFFLFRPGREKLSWRDAHNATAVLSYPFHVVITLSGLLLLCPAVMEPAIRANFGADTRSFIMASRGATIPAAGPQAAAPADKSSSEERSRQRDRNTRPNGDTGLAKERQGAETENTARQQHLGDTAPSAEKPDIQLSALSPLLKAAAQKWPQGAGTVTINNPTGPNPTVELRQKRPEVLRGGGGATEKMVFDGISGRLLNIVERTPPSATLSAWQTLTAIHRGHFAGPLARFLLFASGLCGAAMVASGLVIWTLNRKKRVNSDGQTPFTHRLVDSLNITFIPGMFIAIASFLAGSRLIPVDFAQRVTREQQIFFWTWGICLVHALVRGNKKKAWVEQFVAAGTLFVLLPVVNAVTGGSNLFSSLANSRWSLVGFELIVLILGASFLVTAKKIIRYTPSAPHTSPEMALASESAAIVKNTRSLE